MAGGFFGNLFDLNRDGKLGPVERAMDYALFEQVMKEEEEKKETDENVDE